LGAASFSCFIAAFKGLPPARPCRAGEGKKMEIGFLYSSREQRVSPSKRKEDSAGKPGLRRRAGRQVPPPGVCSLKGKRGRPILNPGISGSLFDKSQPENAPKLPMGP